MTNPPHAAIYRRISEDREGRELGVERQAEDLERLAQRRGYEVVARYTDNDLGASSLSRKRRPEYERMLADARAGQFEIILAYTSGRITRRPRENEDLIDLAEHHHIRYDYVASPTFDLNTSAGRMVARVLAANDAREAEDISERLRRQRLQAAERGEIHGTSRPFGYEADLRTIRESEAAIIRECAARVLAGETVGSVARDINARGVVTSRGNQWRSTALVKMLATARISGRREHTPRREGQPRPLIGEITATAVWAGIISVEDSDRLRAMLTDSGRSNGRRLNKHLLSGILVCWSCKRGLAGRKNRDIERYGCVPNAGLPNCGRTLVTVTFADDTIRDMVLVALESDEFRERLHQRAEVDPAVRKAITKDERKLEELAEEWASTDSTLTRGEWRTAREIIDERLVRNRAQLDRANGTTALDGFTGSYDEMLALWMKRNTSQRRAIVQAVLISVTVLPSKRKYDKSRFDPLWRV